MAASKEAWGWGGAAYWGDSPAAAAAAACSPFMWYGLAFFMLMYAMGSSLNRCWWTETSLIEKGGDTLPHEGGRVRSGRKSAKLSLFMARVLANLHSTRGGSARHENSHENCPTLATTELWKRLWTQTKPNNHQLITNYHNHHSVEVHLGINITQYFKTKQSFESRRKNNHLILSIWALQDQKTELKWSLDSWCALQNQYYWTVQDQSFWKSLMIMQTKPNNHHLILYHLWMLRSESVKIVTPKLSWKSHQGKKKLREVWLKDEEVRSDQSGGQEGFDTWVSRGGSGGLSRSEDSSEKTPRGNQVGLGLVGALLAS